MKFLHTSDLHIGKKLDGVCRLDEQARVLKEISQIAKDREVDAVLISGDVFDTFIPSSDAENLFFEFLNDLSEMNKTVICISGNHDDADRLAASKALAEKRGIYLCSGNNCFTEKTFGGVSLVGQGKNHLVLKGEDGEEIFVATVPYFGEAPIGTAVDREKEFGDRVKDIFEEIFKDRKKEQSCIMLAHLFMLGGERSEGERNIDLGGVKAVSPLAVPDCCLYTALGHLHKRQVVSRSRNIIYSGSPLQYAYDEVGLKKSVTVFEVKNGELKSCSEVELLSGVKLAKVSVNGIESADVILSKFTDYFVDFTIISDRALAVEETAMIKAKYPNVTKLKLELVSSGRGEGITGRRNLSDTDLFIEFYTKKYGSKPDEDIMSAFTEILEEE